jgi:hypothetical protein
VLIWMLSAESEKTRALAARRITVAALWDKCDDDDLQLAVSGDAACRAAVADVLARNLGERTVQSKCRDLLPRFFSDTDKKVREKTYSCFRCLTDEGLSQERELIHRFISSQAFVDDNAQLALALRDSNALLPNIVVAIPERIIQIHRAKHGDASLEVHRNIMYVPELVIRLYQQTSDTTLKSRCLDFLDAMLSLEVHEVEEQMEKAQR